MQHYTYGPAHKIWFYGFMVKESWAGGVKK